MEISITPCPTGFLLPEFYPPRSVWMHRGGGDGVFKYIKLNIMKFKESNEYQDIKREMEQTDSINKVTSFGSFSDNMISYGFTKEEFFHEFVIISNDTFIADMKVIDLLELKDVQYFEHSIYTKNQMIDSRTWNIKNI